MKSELIKVRVTEKERDNAIELSQLFGKKNLSEFIRYLINDLWEVYEETSLDGFTIIEFLLEYRKKYEYGIASRSMSDLELRLLLNKIKLLEEIKKEKGL